MIKRLFNLITSVILIIALLTALALILPRLMGYKSFAVLSGSMEPALHVGSVAVVKPVLPDSIKVGDQITFVMTDKNSVVATHRVIAIDIAKREFTTKGDANETQDISPVSFDKLIGKGVFSIPLLGFVTIYLSTANGRQVAFVSFIALILIMLLPELFKKKPLKTKPLNCNNSIE